MAKPIASWLWFICLGVALFFLVAPLPAGAASPQERYVRVEASSFQYAPAVIRVNPGDRLTLELFSSDVMHGLYIDGYGINLAAEPGQSVRVTFTADRAGVFRLRCSVTCGALHPFMLGKLVVGGNALIWRAVGLSLLAGLVVFYQSRPPHLFRAPPA